MGKEITVPELHVNTQFINNTRMIRTLVKQQVAISNTVREYNVAFDGNGKIFNIISLCSKQSVQFDQKLTAIKC